MRYNFPFCIGPGSGNFFQAHVSTRFIFLPDPIKLNPIRTGPKCTGLPFLTGLHMSLCMQISLLIGNSHISGEFEVRIPITTSKLTILIFLTIEVGLVDVDIFNSDKKLKKVENVFDP
jgi:hypothetical protein